MGKNLGAALEQKANGNQSVSLANVKSLLNAPNIKKKFEEVLGKRSPQFMTSIVNLVNSEKSLQDVDQMSIVTSCMVAATLDLPVDKNLGYAWIVPYSGRGTFQMGYKGYIQLALRSGQYKYMNAIAVREGELISWNPLTEEFVIDFDKKASEAVIGYAGYFELINGFRKAVYWKKSDIEAHKKKFSKSDYGWNKDWDAMAIKTVIRNMLSKWGILSIEMREAYSADVDTKLEYGDELTNSNVIDMDFSVVKDEEQPSEGAKEEGEKEGLIDLEKDELKLE